jgi:hypothetical protein
MKFAFNCARDWRSTFCLSSDPTSGIGMDDSPDVIGPNLAPKRTMKEKARRVVRAFTTKYADRNLPLRTS